jgi:hypothetical protein
LSALRAFRRELPKVRTTNHDHPAHVGIGWAMARMPRYRGIGRAQWSADRTYNERVADITDMTDTNHPFSAHRSHGPQSAAGPAGAPEEAARLIQGACTGRPTPVGTGAAPETWRRRIAEEFIHQEGVCS